MSYLAAQTGAQTRAKAVILVGGVHALIAAGLVAGLTISYELMPPEKKVKTIFTEAELPPPPPPDKVEPTPDIPSYTPPVAPVPKLDPIFKPKIIVEEVGPIIEDTGTTLIPVTSELPPTGLVDPIGPPTYPPVGASPRNDQSGWISTNDYPRRDLVRGNEGTARYRLVVGSDGRVDACEITSGSGHAGLDRATCRLIERRARFNPAKDSSGEIIVGTYSGSVSWQIPD